MSRSGYSEDCDDQWTMIMWRGRVASATKGKRGQTLLRDLGAALDAMPEKRLIKNELEAAGEVCALGQLGRVRGVDLSNIDPEDAARVAGKFDIATCLAQEIVYINDEAGMGRIVEGKYMPETPEERWTRVRAWVASQVKPEPRS